MAAWQPSNEGLQQLLGLFKASTQADNAQHRAIQQQLRDFNAVPDYNNYLAYILNLQQEEGQVRQSAGLVLKNNVKEHWKTVSPQIREYVQAALLHSINAPEPYIRATVSSCISTMVYVAGLEGWPNLLLTLYQMLDSTDPHVLDGAFSTLAKICEDSCERLAADPNQQPLNLLIPKFISFFSSPHEPLRRYAVGCVNHFILLLSEPLKQNMDGYLQALFGLANDPSSEVRKSLCQALVMLLEVAIDKLMPHMRDVVQYMLKATADEDEFVALEACEFWSSICETKVAIEALGDALPQLVPVLLKGMVYSEEDILTLDAEDEEDEHIADRPEEIKPRFHRSKVVGGLSGGGAEVGEEEDEEEDEEEEDDDDDDDGEVSEWNLRKCSASGLDILAGTFKEAILPTLLPLLQERLASPQWEVRESGILALGAIAEGCIDHIVVFLPQLAPWLIQTLSEPKPLIRSITCWTLSRYSKWIVSQPQQDVYLRPLMQELLKRVLDHNKKVQEAACSAFATLEEDAQLLLVPYLEPILKNLMFACQKYQAKNLLILYDAIGTLADSVGGELNRQEYVMILMPPLIERWNALVDTDKGLFPLLECFTSIAQALGVGFQPYAQGVFSRCLRLIEGTLLLEHQANSEGIEPPDKELVVCALDLISGMTEGMGASIEHVVAQTMMPQLLLACMNDPQPDVRQSAYALVGDLAKASIGVLAPVLQDVLRILVHQLDPEYVSVCNNASWAIGEIAVKVGAEMNPFVESILQQLIPIMNRHQEGLNKSLVENTAITIGRLGLVAPQLAAPHLDTFVKAWCFSLRSIRDDIEKEHAFQGLCNMIKLNPRAPLESILQLCDAIGSWARPPDDLNEMFKQILQGYKSSINAEQWAQFYATFPEYLAKRLTERYGL